MDQDLKKKIEQAELDLIENPISEIEYQVFNYDGKEFTVIRARAIEKMKRNKGNIVLLDDVKFVLQSSSKVA